MLLQGRHFQTGFPVEIAVEAGRIACVTPLDNPPPAALRHWLAPAFCDLQVNGCLGISFNSSQLNDADVHRVIDTCARHGTSTFLPTLITQARAPLERAFRLLARLRDRDPRVARAIPGFHLEGPYISAEDGPRGAHPRAHVRRPDEDEFRAWQEAAAGGIRIVTLAPELPGALPFIERRAREGLVVALGHTAATPAQIQDAIAAGARLSTHLGNGAHPLLPRHPNVLWEQLADDRLAASLIADGHHLPAAVLKCMLRVKTPARVVLISDAGSLAGLEPGTYESWGQTLEVHAEGKIVLPGTGLLAGSAVFLDHCVRHLASRGLATLPEAIAMASCQPRALLGLPPARLEVGETVEVIAIEDPA